MEGNSQQPKVKLRLKGVVRIQKLLTDKKEKMLWIDLATSIYMYVIYICNNIDITNYYQDRKYICMFVCCVCMCAYDLFTLYDPVANKNTPQNLQKNNSIKYLDKIPIKIRYSTLTPHGS